MSYAYNTSIQGQITLTEPTLKRIAELLKKYPPNEIGPRNYIMIDFSADSTMDDDYQESLEIRHLDDQTGDECYIREKGDESIIEPMK